MRTMRAMTVPGTMRPLTVRDRFRLPPSGRYMNENVLRPSGKMRTPKPVTVVSHSQACRLPGGTRASLTRFWVSFLAIWRFLPATAHGQHLAPKSRLARSGAIWRGTSGNQGNPGHASCFIWGGVTAQGARLTLERGELDGHPSAFFSSVRSTRPAWLRDKTAKAIVQYGPEKLAELSDVPFAPDLVAHDDDRLVMEAAFAPLALGRPFLVPPD